MAEIQNPQRGLYRPEFEHDGCGVGVVANIKGIKSHDIVEKGLEVLANLAHRGASGSDPLTGDGAGIMLQMPDSFFRKATGQLGFELPIFGDYGVGTVFLPKAPEAKAAYERIFEEVVREEGQHLLGWRDVPLDDGSIGSVAREVRPDIRHIFLAKGRDLVDQGQFERKLYVIRKVVEQRVAASGIQEAEDFYIPSLSTNRVVYKGLLMGTQLRGFYTDLNDPSLVSSFAMVHSRFSTNTLGSWKLAHPYRHVCHNGEINTLRGNINWMTARQGNMASPLFGDDLPKLFPIITAGASDTASLDNALEFLLHTGRSLPHVMMMLVPEAWGPEIQMPQEKRDFYEYHSCLMEPWDGPALIAFTDGNRLGAVLDRNGLRPFRYLVTKDDLLVMASEVGVLDVPPQDVLYKSRIEPGRMFLVDPEQGGIVEDETIKANLARHRPYGEWLKKYRVVLNGTPTPNVGKAPLRKSESPGKEQDANDLIFKQRAFGYTLEDLDHLIEPMAATGTEPIGSMGNDTPLAVLSEQPQLLFNYFKQQFAQVSNPPLDAIREELVTSLTTWVGRQENIFDETPQTANLLRLDSPILTDATLAQLRDINHGALQAITLSSLFDATAGEGELSRAIDRLCREASQAIEDGFTIIIISDRGMDHRQAAIPSLLATASVHHHLIREGKRTGTGLVIESGEPREVMHFALLIGYGAAAINPYLAYATLRELAQQKTINGTIDTPTAELNYIKSINKGILKVISKMGISTVQSYSGAQIFEAVGLSSELVERCFTWTPSRIGGIGLQHLEADVRKRHSQAYVANSFATTQQLEGGSTYSWRRSGEYHMWNPDTIAQLQDASQRNDSRAYKKFADLANSYEKRLCTLRGLLEFKFLANPISLDDVEPASEIVKRFATGAISLGAISREAHETLAIAMNRIGARSNSGEGGEDYRRFTPDANGDHRYSAVKQVASGRFGVTTNYLVNATDLQIKMAQGSKPGEGGQLPGNKVDDYIGWVRHSTPGVELISPPPHHDIYSIEDLAQLIHDLKNVNPLARIHVKLVAEAGVGTIAAGVSKAHADVVLISGDSGGTGASPESSVKHAGLPWELGIAETQQVLVANNLRDRIVVQADGQIKTGRDIAIACLLGAEEFGIATASLVTLGCIMLRKCHLNTCSVGIATQDPELRKRFAGKPESLINYFFFLAEELRGIMAQMGFRTINEMVGRVDRLDPYKAIDHWKSRGLDLSALLYKPHTTNEVTIHQSREQDHGLEAALDHKLIALANEALQEQKPVEISLAIRNANRTVGAMLSGKVARRYGEEGLPDGTIQCTFNGSAGQSFAAFLAKGISFTLEGDANDYFGKGISGGRLVVFPPIESSFIAEDNIIVGNVALYGATGGEVYIRGRAGERFCVRNSGARTVVEGIGDHGCEYMTFGTVVVLGPTGRNFAAGMSGGIAYIFDDGGHFIDRCNQGMVDLEPVWELEDCQELRALLRNHYTFTGSASAKRILEDWDAMLPRFVKVFPRDYRRVLETRKLSQIESVNRG
jgi:glutamate synthase (NADPH/NADH) large chain